MPVVTRRSTPSPRATRGASGSAPAAAATASTARAVTAPRRGRSGSQAGDKAVPVVINGFGGKPFPTVNLTLVPQPGQVGSREAHADIGSGGWVSRGYIDVRYTPAVGGVDVEVESRHSKPSDPKKYKGDDMAVYLQARVRDRGKERVVTLATMFDGVFNDKGTSSAVRRFHVDYDAVNKWLKKKAPHLELKVGDPLAVHAVWKGTGHQWGGFMREGSFDAPAPIGRANAVDARAGRIGQAPTPVSVSDVQKPIDITHKVPPDLVKAYPLVLDKGAKLVSRREHETKFCPRSMTELKSVTKKLLAVCDGDDKAREKALLDIFGPDKALSKARGYPVSGWKISTTDRYYEHDEDGAVVVGKDGLPVVAPMFDVYQDDPSPSAGNRFPFASSNMAVRFRDGEIAHGAVVGSMGKLNMKTPRVADPFSLIQTGLELSLDTIPGISKNEAAMKQLGDFLDNAPAPYNPLLEQRKVDANLDGANVQKSAVDNLADRYKLTLEHETGMEIEVSLDFVHAGFIFEDKVVEATKGLSDAKKYDHYAALLKKPDAAVVCASGPRKTDRGELNTVVFKDDKGHLVMANFWLDDKGKKHASEHPAVQFPQVEMEMDHVQARTVGPVQAAYVNPSEVKTLSDDATQDKFLAGLSDKASMNGPPTAHAWEDLKNAKLYEEHNYQELAQAVTAFRTHFFPKGVKPARQKAAQALQLGGYVKKRPLTLAGSIPWVQGRGVSVNVDWQNHDRILISGMPGATLGEPATMALDFDGFPLTIPLKKTATAKDVAEAVRARLAEAVLYEVDVKQSTADGRTTYTLTVSER